jgi:hypothetical protein
MTEDSAFWEGSAFLRFWGQGEHGVQTSDAEIAPYVASVDPLIGEFWRRFGWAQFGAGFLVVDSPARLLQPYAAWPLPPSALPLLRTAWGHLLLVQGESSLMLDPIYGGVRDLGCDAVTVLDALLVTEDFLNQDLLWDVYRGATRRIGRAPSTQECVTFVPALALGGERHERHVQIRDLPTTLDLLAQI